MIIDNNETEKRAMKEFHLAIEKKALKSRKNLPLLFAQSMPIRITAPAQKHADITQLQGMRCHTPGAPGACAKLYAPDH